ncbi:MAG TPA: DUF4097 family beta strand repeat-containing protein [Bryobacteraceae bacterium]|jgi:hypothetical protein
MKPIAALAALTLMVCAPAAAQDRVVVPPSATTGPREVQASLMHGSIVVKAHSGKEVIVESSGGASSTRRTPPAGASGMHRIDLPRNAGLDVEGNDTTVNIRTRLNVSTLTVTVPTETTLHLKTMHGDISVEGVNGEIEVSTLNGQLKLTDVAGSVLAHSQNGPMTVTMTRLGNKPLSFVSFNGTIDVTLPANAKANLKMRTDHGEIYSDFDMALTSGGASSTRTNSPDGRFRIAFDRTIYATINGGGPEVELRTYNGRILVRKK